MPSPPHGRRITNRTPTTARNPQILADAANAGNQPIGASGEPSEDVILRPLHKKRLLRRSRSRSRRAIGANPSRVLIYATTSLDIRHGRYQEKSMKGRESAKSWTARLSYRRLLTPFDATVALIP
jgi:hypothetical protein